MRLCSYRIGRKNTFGIVTPRGLVDAAPIAHRVGATLKEALARDALSEIDVWAKTQTKVDSLDEVEFLPVIPDPTRILCVVGNHRRRVEVLGEADPIHPLVFIRSSESQVGHQQAIMRPTGSQKLDFEGSFALVIGRQARYVRAKDAMSYVAGYAAYNDASVRELEKRTTRLLPSRNFPCTGGFGPWLVTVDEMADPATLSTQTRLNGVVIKDMHSDDLFFSMPQLIEFISAFTTLAPGDVVITSTACAVGEVSNPALQVQPGDIVEVEIPGFGVLCNTVIDGDAESSSYLQNKTGNPWEHYYL